MKMTSDLEEQESNTLALLREGRVESCYLMPAGSNYTFLVCLKEASLGSCEAVYKPQQGEAPLWDFPQGTLYLRERAAYLVCQAVGWKFVPLTVLRDGPHGVGSMQLFVQGEPGSTYFTLRNTDPWELKRIAVFDYITNNADRKAGHCFKGLDGGVWGIDHGLTFNAVYKLRTVIWDFAGQAIPQEFLMDLEDLEHRLEKGDPIVEELSQCLYMEEVEAFRGRIKNLLEHQRFPKPGPHRSVPWPLV